MTQTTDERMAAALHEATRDLVPRPGLAAAAIAQSRRFRHRVAAGLGAVAIAVGVGAAAFLPGSGGDPEVADGPLTESPDWSGCAARLPAVNKDLGQRELQPSASAVEVAVCGPVVAGDDEVTMDVHVAGVDDARRIARLVLQSDEGALIEGCVYQVRCVPTYFALRLADGTVVRLVVTDLGNSAVVADASTSRVRAVRVRDAVLRVQSDAPWYTYHARDTPHPPFAFDDLECPDEVPVEDWQTYLASPGSGESDVVAGPMNRVVICAYRPAAVVDGLIRVRVGIGYEGREAADLVALIEGAPRRDATENEECRADEGLAYLVIAGSGDTMSRVLYAQTYGCRIAGDVTPDIPDDERLAPRHVTDEIAAALLTAVGPENVE